MEEWLERSYKFSTFSYSSFGIELEQSRVYQLGCVGEEKNVGWVKVLRGACGGGEQHSICDSI